MRFLNRKEAGRAVSKLLREYEGAPNTVVIGLARGGVVVAAEIAKKLKLPLDVMAPRKIGSPTNPEFAIGAVTEEGDVTCDENPLKSSVEREIQEARRRIEKYRGGKAALQLKGKTAILVDDGVATGNTMRASVQSARTKGAKKIVVAVPVIDRWVASTLEQEADELITVLASDSLGSVGEFYSSFDQTSDEEVISLLKMYEKNMAQPIA